MWLHRSFSVQQFDVGASQQVLDERLEIYLDGKGVSANMRGRTINLRSFKDTLDLEGW